MVRFSEHFEGDGKQVFRHVCRLGLEGVVSKLDAPYRSGRSKGWIKSKCFNRQEFVVAGFVTSTVSNTSIGSLVLGYFDDGKLIHAGRVGTGFSHKVADELFRRLDAMSIPKSPFAKKLSAHWMPGACASSGPSWSRKWSFAPGRRRAGPPLNVSRPA